MSTVTASPAGKGSRGEKTQSQRGSIFKTVTLSITLEFFAFSGLTTHSFLRYSEIKYVMCREKCEK